jgi:hypothetical protein
MRYQGHGTDRVGFNAGTFGPTSVSLDIGPIRTLRLLSRLNKQNEYGVQRT